MRESALINQQSVNTVLRSDNGEPPGETAIENKKERKNKFGNK